MAEPKQLTERQIAAIVRSHPAAIALADEQVRAATTSPEGIDGWWEFGMGGQVDSAGRPVIPLYASNPEDIERSIARYPEKGWYLMRRWVTPGSWVIFTAADYWADEPDSAPRTAPKGNTEDTK